MTSKMEIVPDDGTATLFTVSERLGMHFWIDDDAVFMSAPSYATGGGCDMDNAIAVEDWESFTELTPDDFSHLFGYVFKMCVLHRDYVRVGYYSKLFGGTTNDSGQRHFYAVQSFLKMMNLQNMEHY